MGEILFIGVRCQTNWLPYLFPVGSFDKFLIPIGHCSGSYIISCLCKSQFEGRSKIKNFFCGFQMCTVLPTEYTEWKRPLSSVHSILMEKSAQAGQGGGCTPTPLSPYLPLRTKFCSIRPSWEGRYRYTPLFLLYPYMYSVISPVHRIPLEWSWETF
jgi:hypothetical protein